jgi:hypothetical protein
MVEPWGMHGVQEKVAYIAPYGNDLWPEHPVRACTFLEKFGEQNPETVLAVLHEASFYCDDMGYRSGSGEDPLGHQLSEYAGHLASSPQSH